MKSDKEIIEAGKIWDAQATPPMMSGWIKLPDCKRCSVVWSRNEGGYEHVSVSPINKFIMPSWDDMCALKDIFFDDEEEVYQIHPPKSEYVNMMSNCLHLWKRADGTRISDWRKEE